MNRGTVAWGSGSLLGLTLLAGGCRKTAAPAVLEIQPREVSPDELKYAVTQLPTGFRDGLSGSEAEIAKQLGLRVWAFDFKGGPFGAWIEIEETGQQTAQSPFARTPGMTLRCDGEEGMLLFWFQPRITQQMAQPLKDRLLGNEPQVPNLFVAVETDGKRTMRMEQHGNPDKPVVPLWFGWKEAELTEQASPATLNSGEYAAILLIEATEKIADNPRRAKLVFTVQK